MLLVAIIAYFVAYFTIDTGNMLEYNKIANIEVATFVERKNNNG